MYIGYYDSVFFFFFFFFFFFVTYLSRYGVILTFKVFLIFEYLASIEFLENLVAWFTENAISSFFFFLLLIHRIGIKLIVYNNQFFFC